MNEQEDIDVSDFRTDRIWRTLSDSPNHPTLRLISLFFVIGGLSHLWLADAWQWSWLPGNICFFVGLAILLVRPCALAWALCTIGKFLPLFFARDHLTQSLLMMLFAGGGMIFTGLHAYYATISASPTVSDTSYGQVSGPILAFFDLLKAGTIATYALAGFHKLNRDFFSADISCAVQGINKFADHYGAVAPSITGTSMTAFAIAVIAMEAGIAILYLVQQRRLALVVALLFHIPITLTMAPAFAFVMLAGHAAFLRPADIEIFRRFLIRNRIAVVISATTITAISIFLHGGPPFDDWTMAPREWLLWALLVTAVGARPWYPAMPDSRPWSRPRWPRILAWSMAAFFVVNSLTPYLGVRFQHTGAMVSNLRIDDGCWNHLLVPESMRLRDDYIRFDRAYFGEPGRIEKYEKIAVDQLWNGTQVRQMRRNWCRDELRPFYVEGTYRKQVFSIDDLCAEDLNWPFSDDGIFGVELFPDHLLFQRNLPRKCAASCIH